LPSLSKSNTSTARLTAEWLYQISNGRRWSASHLRLVRDWMTSIGLEPSAYGTHSMRRTKVAQIYRKTGNLRAVQLLLGNTKMDSTVRYLGVELEDALAIAEAVEICTGRAGLSLPARSCLCPRQSNSAPAARIADVRRSLEARPSTEVQKAEISCSASAFRYTRFARRGLYSRPEQYSFLTRLRIGGL
jgi:hypothetical protein